MKISTKRSIAMQRSYEDYLLLGKEPFSENEIVESEFHYRVYKNMFPYDLIASEHLLLVVRPEYDPDETYYSIMRRLYDYISEGYTVFENLSQDRSVKEYRHFHIIKKL